MIFRDKGESRLNFGDRRGHDDRVDNSLVVMNSFDASIAEEKHEP